MFNKAKGGSWLLASYSDLDLVLEESFTTSLILDTAQRKNILSSLTEGVGLDPEAILLNTGDSLRLAFTIMHNLPFQIEGSLAVKEDIEFNFRVKTSIDNTG